MTMTKLKKEYDQKMRESRPGSGFLWQNQITVPVTPNLTGLSKNRDRFVRSKS